ncbi:MAG: methionyl-tRNA formyltransferase, partial [Acidobacteria bacterium]|nr:methionyl-tRNA formyltransferase [Acidobacteriota bacterium]
DVAAVFSQPDRPVGRGGKLTAPPVKQAALELRLEVYQPESAKTGEVYSYLQDKQPDVIVVVGYGQIISQRVIDLPRLGCVNVHSSLLPQLRGAAPINWAIVRGDKKTGVSTMQIVKKLDAGDVLGVKELAIGDDEYAPELASRLAENGALLLIETLQQLEIGAVTPQPQDDAESTYAPIMKREDGLVDWNLPAQEIYNRVRGFSPWPGAYTFFRGKRFHIHRALVAPGHATPATMVVEGSVLKIGCGEGLLQALEVQLEGKRAMATEDFVNGYRPAVDEKLSDQAG